MGKQTGILLVFLVLFYPVTALANFDHSQWGRLLDKHLVEINGGRETQLSYDGMLADRDILHAYLAGIAEVDREAFDNWELSDQLAFLINVYNAWTVELVLTEYPDIDSIKDIGFLFSSPWRQRIVFLFGERVSLDDIEHGMIRGWNRYKEPRIHFAVNCAAVGCPPLRGEAYVGDKLEQQLEDNTRLFLMDRTRNYFSSGRLYISSIFKWYEEDFEKGWMGVNSVAEFLLPYADVLELDNETKSSLDKGQLRIRYLKYDWNLNRVP
ncbi:MAG: DUF547 domain-containing protein [SAR86 cluster bacterium]|uniref:DUF547 domain-containing protein n=1 Tax=SAR86 cluster bacterium TaxID=2030880 RepID=A0A2A5B8U8_9GAMM|nr:MAG: DUF547 domain-containing protein [SAR86 cluster bacterium]